MLGKGILAALALGLLTQKAGAEIYVEDSEGNAFVAQDYGTTFRLTAVYWGTLNRTSVGGAKIEATDVVEAIFIEADCLAWHNYLGPGRFGSTTDGFAVTFDGYLAITFPDQVIPWPELETCALKE